MHLAFIAVVGFRMHSCAWQKPREFFRVQSYTKIILEGPPYLEPMLGTLEGGAGKANHREAQGRHYVRYTRKL